MKEGKLVCGNCGHEYKIKEGIANFLLPSHLGQLCQVSLWMRPSTGEVWIREQFETWLIEHCASMRATVATKLSRRASERWHGASAIDRHDLACPWEYHLRPRSG